MAQRQTKGKGKAALKKTGRALKGFARGALQSGAEILGAGAMALNPKKKVMYARWDVVYINPLYVYVKYEPDIMDLAGAKRDAYSALESELGGTAVRQGIAKLKGDPVILSKLPDDVDEIKGAKGWAWIGPGPRRNPKAKTKRKPNKTIIKAKRIDHLDVAKVHNPRKRRAKKKASKRNASTTVSSKPSKTRRAGASSKSGRRKAAPKVRSVAKTRKVATRRASKRAVKRRNAYQWYGLPQRVRFISGEYKGMTGVVQSVIQKRYDKSPDVYRIQIDGFPKPGGWSGKVTAEPHQLEAVKENPLIQPGRRYKMQPDYEPTAIIEQGMRGGFKAVFIAKDGLAGQVGGFKTRQAATAWAKAQGFKAVQKTKKRNNPSAESIRKTFAGSVNGERDLFFPQGTPAGKLAKLGKLVSITTEAGTIKPVHGTAWLCADTKGKLHIGATSNAPLYSGPARNFGHVTKLEYESSKPHLGYGPTIWFHRAGEENGIRPTLRADGKGGLVFRGGDYRLTERGIEN